MIKCIFSKVDQLMDNLHKKMPSNIFKINQLPPFLLMLEEKIE